MSFETKVNDAVAQLAAHGIRNASAQIDGKVVTLHGHAPDLATKSKAMAWFNEQVETENTLNLIRIDAPVASAPPATDATRIPSALPGPVATATAATPAAAASTERRHVVAKGDTLSAIAKHYYGKSSDYMRIFEANKDVLKDPDKIFPGQNLRIP